MFKLSWDQAYEPHSSNFGENNHVKIEKRNICFSKSIWFMLERLTMEAIYLFFKAIDEETQEGKRSEHGFY